MGDRISISRRMMLIATAGLGIAAFTDATLAADDKAPIHFTVPPKIEKAGLQWSIAFTSSAPTDVEVAILDGQGKVVRHIAAGVLGDNAPLPLQKGSLKQILIWDGKDELGQPAKGVPFSVRVGLGLKPVFGGFIGDNPAALGDVRALATGPTGEVFVVHVFGALHPNDGSPSCTVFDREGNYLRTILPYSANLPVEKLKGLKRLTLEDGSKVPFLYQAETRSLLPGAGDLPPQRPIVTKDGRLAFVGIEESPKRYQNAGRNRLIVLHTDGSLPPDGAFRTEVSKVSGSAASLALSPDEKTLYASGLREGYSQGKPTHAVFRFGWDDAEPKLFAGVKNEAGNDERHLNDPRGVAVDQDGNVYVADRGNNRVAIFKPDGTLCGAIVVDRPERVEVHPRTGTVYVIGGERVDQLLKFSSWEQAKPVAELKLPSFKHPNYTAVMALDASAQPPVLWIGSPHGYYAKMDLLRIEDKGAAFGTPVDIGKRAAQARPTAGPVLGMDLDRQRGRLYVNSRLYQLATDQWSAGIREAGGMSIGGLGVGSVGLDGNFYSQIFPDIVRRIGPDLKKLPFSSVSEQDKGELRCPIKGTMRARGRGITADPNGNVYVLWEDGADATRGEAFNHLYVYGPDGTLKKKKLIDAGIRSLNSIRVDYAGNVYLALGLRPGKDLLPPGLKGQVPEAAKDSDAVSGVNCYPLIYGSIVKFGPEGGVIRPNIGGVACNYAWGTHIEVKGAHWMFSGASPVVSWRVPGTPDICNCESPRFDVDGYGRSFFTDAARFRVGMLDTNGNLIGWFGSYGNADSAGPDSKVPTPEIPFYWPYHVSADEGELYVGDRLNRRVVHVRLTHAVVETAAIPRE